MTVTSPSSPPPGLCVDCAHTRRIMSAKGSVFWLCQHQEMPRYPRLPVLVCRSFERATPPARTP